MMQALKRAGMLSELSGLIVGGMTDMNDHKIPFGKSAEEIIRDVVSEFNYPLLSDFLPDTLQIIDPSYLDKRKPYTFLIKSS